MHPGASDRLLLLVVTPAILAAEGVFPIRTEDRVQFPKGYATRFSVLRTVERNAGAKLVTVYGNTLAAGGLRDQQSESTLARLGELEGKGSWNG